MSIDNLSTNYNPANIEQKWYKIWEQQGYFKPQPNPAMSDKQNAFYCLAAAQCHRFAPYGAWL